MKLVNKELNKRIHAIIYFSKNIKYPFELTMFKLLYLLDFKHFKQTGRPVTDLKYFTFKKGPVPIEFYKEIKEDKLSPEIKKCLDIVVERDDLTGEIQFIRFIPKIRLNLKVFTKREQKILEELAFILKETKAEEISEFSHLKNQPWYKTMETKGLFKEIDFFLALDDEATIDKESAKEIYETIIELKRNFSSSNVMSRRSGRRAIKALSPHIKNFTKGTNHEEAIRIDD